jgi:hypothetical protein
MTISGSQSSRRNFQTPRRLCNVYSSAKVESRVYRPNGLVKRLDTHQVSNINKDAFQQGFHYSEVFSNSTLFFKSEDFRFPVSRPDDVSSRPDAHLSTVPSVRTTCHTVRTPSRSSTIRPDDVDFHLDPSLYREAYVPAYIRLDVSAARPNDIQ